MPGDVAGLEILGVKGPQCIKVLTFETIRIGV